MGQKLGSEALRERSGAYPFELPYRLILMYSLYGDTFLDPFLGVGTTAIAAVATGRNSIGVELDPAFSPVLRANVAGAMEGANRRVRCRLADHRSFVAEYQANKGAMKHESRYHACPVTTRQEREIRLYTVESSPSRTPKPGLPPNTRPSRGAEWSFRSPVGSSGSPCDATDIRHSMKKLPKK